MDVMLRLFLITGVCIFSISEMRCQEKNGQVLDFKTHSPISYATIAYGTSGVITNEEGRFAISDYQDARAVTISSLGYESKTVPMDSLGENPIVLHEAAIDLDAVYLANKSLSGEEIMERIKAHVDSNYNFGSLQRRFFLRESHKNTITTFNIQVNKSSIAALDQNLMDSITSSAPKNNDSYIEVLGDLYGSYGQQKLHVIKAADLYNPASTVSFDTLVQKLETIFDKNIKKDSYIRIRSGVIGVSVDADDLTEDDPDESHNSTNAVPSTEDPEKQLVQRRKELQQQSREDLEELMQNPFWKEDITFDLFANSKKYDFTVAGYTSVNGALAYILRFEPRRRSSHFKGVLYVNTADFGVYRVDFKNIKPLKTFRLFGISTADDVYRGKMIFAKNTEGRYDLKYMERQEGKSVGVDRPLTVIEKNKKIAGRRKQNELDMDVLFKNSDTDLYQLVIFGSESIDPTDWNDTEENKEFIYQKFKKYNPDFWKDYTIIEPDQAIQSFSLPEE